MSIESTGAVLSPLLSLFLQIPVTINRHKGTLIYNLKELTLHLKSIYSSASAQPLLGLIELKTQRYSIYIQFDSVSYFSS